ncbi:MAG TPA: hypothetical protein VGC44_02375, partial [Longimicrobiales bacterium]
MQTDTMTRECTALHSYLLGGLPGRYVVEKYVAAHKQLPALTHSAGWFDGFMLTASQVHPV